MSTSTRHTRDAQVDSPARIAQRQRHIRILRAVNLIGRSKCNVAQAARAVGLSDRDHHAMQKVRDLCDVRRIPRKRKWGTRLAVAHTQEPVPQIVRPRDR
jgi:hypothetical protein